MSMKKFRRAFGVWAYGLVGGCIGGGVSSLGAKFGLDGLHAMGVDVPQLTIKQMGYVFLAGVITHGVTYVMKSPLPPLQFDDSAPPSPLPDGSNVKPVEIKP